MVREQLSNEQESPASPASVPTALAPMAEVPTAPVPIAEVPTAAAPIEEVPTVQPLASVNLSETFSSPAPPSQPSSAPASPLTPSFMPPPPAFNNPEETFGANLSTVFDPHRERDEMGRIIRRMRDPEPAPLPELNETHLSILDPPAPAPEQASDNPSPSTSSEAVADATLPVPSTPPSTETQSPVSTMSSSSSSSRAMFSSNEVVRGKGKGGLRMVVSKDKITTDVKALWKEYQTEHSLKVTKIFNKNKRYDEIVCTDCDKPIKTKTYVNHRTKKGCKKIDPLLKWYNFERNHYKKSK